MTETHRSSVVVAAIELALEAGADDAVRVRVIRRLVEMAPERDDGPEPVRALVAAIKTSGTKFTVTPIPQPPKEAQVPHFGKFFCTECGGGPLQRCGLTLVCPDCGTPLTESVVPSKDQEKPNA